MTIAWLTLAQVKSVKNITDTSLDDVITALIPIAEEQVPQLCPRFVPRQTFTELYDGMGGATIVLRRRPTCGVVSVKDSPTRDFANTPAMSTANYVLIPESGLIEFDDLTWLWQPTDDGPRDRNPAALADGNRNVQVIYVAGYGSYNPSDGQDSVDFNTYSVPQDLVMLGADLVMAMVNGAGSEGKKQERIGDYSYTMGDVNDLSPTSRMTIERWADGSQSR